MPTTINFNQPVLITLASDGARVYNAWARKQRLWIMDAMPRDTKTRRDVLSFVVNRKKGDTIKLQLHEIAYIFGGFMVPGQVQLFEDFNFTLVEPILMKPTECAVRVAA